MSHNNEDFEYSRLAEPYHAPSGSEGVSRRARHAYRRQQNKKRQRRLIAVFTVAGLFFGAGLIFALAAPIQSLMNSPSTKDFDGPGKDPVSYELPSGATASQVGTELVGLNVVASEGAFLEAVTAKSASNKLQPGSYELRQEMKASDAVDVLLGKQGPNNKVNAVNIKAGMRVSEALDELANSTKRPREEFEALNKDPGSFGLPSKAPSLEGYLYPSIYRFPKSDSPREMIEKMVKITKDVLKQQGITDPDEQYRVLTLGSIIEAEGRPDYYKTISGAIQNRLNNPQGETSGRIESDATVTYGLGRRSYNITTEEKQDTSNPYNTFAKMGLPVGPIGSPKEPSIIAAAQPEKNPYYFWVTINLDTGETLFAVTYAEHQENVKKYMAWCQANPGKCK